MSMSIRAVVSILAGIGSGALGFWAMWKVVAWATKAHPSSHPAWLVVGIFAPLIAVAVVTFFALGRSEEKNAPLAE
jgi:hypothetical protein